MSDINNYLCGKKILSINLGNYGSTGGIVHGIGDILQKTNNVLYSAYPGGEKNKSKEKNDIIISSCLIKKINQRLSMYSGYNGCFAILSTWLLLRKIKRINPTIIHLHNLHNSYINLKILFRYLKKSNIPIIWTLHDCWSFTGRCPHFQISQCDQWKCGCSNCNYPPYDYPESLINRSSYMWKHKKDWFTGVDNLTIVTPSEWLSSLVSQSFLNEYEVRVINNGINLHLFRPITSDWKSEKRITSKYIVLGVASDWSYKKGVDVFVKLAKDLPSDYQVVIIGGIESLDIEMPKNLISINHTESVDELVKAYSSATVFVNPTREDTFPTVNIEALACGTPIVAYKTGGSPEILNNDTGFIVEKDDYDSLKSKVIITCEKKVFSEKNCLERAKKFESTEKYTEYYKLYIESLEK